MMVIEVEHRVMLEVQAKFICMNIFVFMYGSMLYSYFYDDTHIVLMMSISRLAKLVGFTVLIGMFIPVILLSYVGLDE